MLSFQTVQPDTLELLKSLMQLPLLRDMRLVGGTALALQYGHRRSVDLGFFGHTTDDAGELTEAIRDEFGQVQLLSASKRIKVYNIRNVKVDIVNYDYPWIDDAVVEENIRLASPKDIAAMKVNAIIGRGTKKDFIDIYYLLQHFTFDELLRLYLKKYPDGSEYRALLSMSYFADADPQALPYMFDDVGWDTIKQKIRKEQEVYNNKNNK
ncbi:MAG: nucleotidyl transferase AbiEii/AbiGii toxin family protein [Prevotella sp.]|nr:nucleotidyl transferase AbiEii/AbiGii toxin family protein [Prevotella sp.]